MAKNSLEPHYENGVPVFTPSYEDFKDFRSFVNLIEPIGMTTGIVKIIPPEEWKSKLPKLPTAVIDQIDVRNPIEQNITINGGRGIYSIDNIEKRRKYSMKQWIKQCNLLSNQPPTRRGQTQRILGSLSIANGDFVSYDDKDFSSELLADLESKYWKGLAYGGSPMYGADLLGSLFTDSTKEWNVANLDSHLKALPQKLPGVTEAYLYCGMWKATFSWHVEDMDLPSINYIHFGAPKQWYTIPQSHHKEFYDLMSALWPDDSGKCPEFLRHKTYLLDPAFIAKQGIPVNRIVHRQEEFIITFPYGYHAGFNYGFNIAESVNFAHDSWLDIGLKANKCTCVSHSVGIDVANLIDCIKTKNSNDEPAQQIHETESIQPFPNQRLGNCILCPHIFNNRYISNSANNAQAHLTCANLIPETWIAGRTVYGLNGIDKERFGLKCGYCKLSMGCCFQCSKAKCTRSYHGSCAAAAGADYHNPYRPLCRYHREKDSRKCSKSLLPGDVIQFQIDKSFSAGVMTKRDGDTLELQALPNMMTSTKINQGDVTDVFDEKATGPFIEPLAEFKRYQTKRIKVEPEGLQSQLPTPPQSSELLESR